MKRLFSAITLVLLICVCFGCKNSTNNNTGSSNINSDQLAQLATLKPMIDEPTAVITTDTITKLKKLPAYYIGFARVKENSLACIFLNQSSNPKAVSGIVGLDSIGVEMMNCVLVKQRDKLSVVTVRHAFEGDLIRRVHGWDSVKIGDMMSCKEAAPSHPHLSTTIADPTKTIDSVVMVGYRILHKEHKMVFYSIKGRAVKVTPTMAESIVAIYKQNPQFAHGPNPVYDIMNSGRCYAIHVEEDFGPSILGLSGSGVYRIVNGQRVDELIGMQSQRFGVALGETSSPHPGAAEMEKLKKHWWLIFQRITPDDIP